MLRDGLFDNGPADVSSFYTPDFWEARVTDVRELSRFAAIPDGVEYFTDPGLIKPWLERLTANSLRSFVYVTGGFDCALHHQLLIQAIGERKWGMILGLEPDEFFHRKGKEPHTTLDERIAYWMRICRPPAAVFTVPPPDSVDYVLLANATGTYQHPQVLQLMSSDDPYEVAFARRMRCYSQANLLVASVFIQNGALRLSLTHGGDMVHV